MDSSGHRSWTRQAFEATGWTPLAAGLALTLAGAVVFTLQEAWLGRFSRLGEEPSLLGDMRVSLTHVVILAYLMAASVYFESVRDAVLCDLRERFGDAPQSVGLDGLTTAIAIGFGIGIAALLSSTISPGPTSYDPRTWSPETGWHRLTGLVLGAATSRLFFLVLIDARRISHFAARTTQVDLLAPERNAPFVRIGLTGALLSIGAFSVYALFLLDVGYLPLVAGLFVLSVVLGGLALLLPLRGLRRSLQQAKREELAWCRTRMRQARDRLRQGESSGDLEELLAWEARIHSVPEWPVDSSTLRRFGLYLLIPLGSWAGAALVERAIDMLLD